VTRIMRATHLLFVGLALLASASGALAQGARCSVPDKSFESLLARFSENEQFRSGRIVFPMIYRHGRFENGDLQAQLWDAERVTALGIPLFLSRTQRAARDVVQELPLVTRLRRGVSPQT
jgi:hypothetical protein